jgi:hypothetical protein
MRVGHGEVGSRRLDRNAAPKWSDVVVSMAMRSSSGLDALLRGAGRGNDVSRASCFACAINGGLAGTRRSHVMLS